MFWQRFAQTNMVLAWLPCAFGIYALVSGTGEGGHGGLGTLAWIPVTFVLGLIWFLMSLGFLKILKQMASTK
jgi:hypothetical protein